MSPWLQLIGALAVLTLAGRELAAAAKALGLPRELVATLETIALR